MEASELAKRFIKFLNTEWESPPDPGSSMQGLFEDWAQEVDLFTSTEDQATALQTLILAWAWFTQRPEDFGICAPMITTLTDGVDPDEPSEAEQPLTLTGLLDPVCWRARLFVRKYGTR